MGYYDLSAAERAAMNVDPDFCYALEYNPQPFALGDVKRVLAVVEGEHDEADWHWIAALKDGRFVYLTGGCDYTGWD